ncbi:MAG: AAA family ATPase [Prevotellaceae bacterium]|jgi:rRNA-processing protein FCF1|nr:AAA family ATPase [Prevotellaceae bacterium]
MVTKENQIKFYAEELRELEFSVKKTFNSTGFSLFQNGTVYVGQYKGIDEKRGNVFVDIPTGEGYHSPRLDQKMNCFTLKAGMERPATWGNVIYADLLKDRNRTETKIVDFIPSKREGWITVLLREMESEFVENLQYNQIIAFGPTIPPFEYLQNLKEFSESFDKNENSIWSKILNFQYDLNKSRQPILLTEEIDIAQSIIDDVQNSVVYLFQGPPGTGKTHQIADVASRLVLDGNSVLITALTNKATVEVCEKPFFDELFEEKRVSKLPLSIDERNKFPHLFNAKELVPSKGHLTLTTYYQFSKIWQSQTQTYDYVIVEEASQAFLTTIAAATKVGKKVIVVGDPKQIIPIVTNKNFNIFPNIKELINGMDTLSQVDSFVFKRKIETRRLTERSTKYTNCFYENTIQSKSLFKDIKEDFERLPTLSSYMQIDGGPSLILFPNDKENLLHLMDDFIINAINELSLLKHNTIAVLTPYIETLTYFQQNLKSKTNNRNFLIETVDRVQGLDVDYCFYVIPKSSSFSFNSNRFNVATSRAKKSTFILVEQDFDRIVSLPSEVAQYLSKLKSEFSFHLSSETKEIKRNVIEASSQNDKENEIGNLSSATGIKLKVIGKIDVSQFEKTKKEIRKDKKNLYIIDTNAFVEYPEIISKIGKNYAVILSAKVLDELDKLKSTLDDQGKTNVQKALKSINTNIDKREIKLEIADLSLLPIDFNKRSPDNFILSVALKYNNENPILLTSDNGLQIKAKGLNITTITLKEFLKQSR